MTMPQAESTTTPSPEVTVLHHQGKTVHLIGTAHVSRASAELAENMIEEIRPDTVCVELCEPRFEAIRKPDRWMETDIVKVIREKKAFLLLSNLLLAAFQKRIADKMEIRPGEEMVRAIRAAETTGATIHLADREIRLTLSRIWRSMGFFAKIKLMFQLMVATVEADEIEEEEIERLKNEDVLASLLEELGGAHPVLRKVLIDERDRYLAEKIRTAPGETIVAVVGAGHVPGIRTYWETPQDLAELESLPPAGNTGTILKWGIPIAICLLFVAGFFFGGKEAGTGMLFWWVLVNGVLAGTGATIAMAHPLTILSAVCAAPLTSLNPMIAAGWVSGLVEAICRKPRVADLQKLGEDISTIRGFWKNKVTRILLVVVFTNIGSAVGTFIALPLMLKFLGS